MQKPWVRVPSNIQTQALDANRMRLVSGRACGMFQHQLFKNLIPVFSAGSGFSVVMKLQCHLCHCDDKEAVSEHASGF